MAASSGCVREKNARHEASAFLMKAARCVETVRPDGDLIVFVAELVETDADELQPDAVSSISAAATLHGVLIGGRWRPTREVISKERVDFLRHSAREHHCTEKDA